MQQEAEQLFRELGMSWELEHCLALSDDVVTQKWVQLPSLQSLPGRLPSACEQVGVLWTVRHADDELIPLKVKRRQHIMMRLVKEAGEQGASVTLKALEKMLGVSKSTIKRDLIALRDEGLEVQLHGSRR